MRGHGDQFRIGAIGVLANHCVGHTLAAESCRAKFTAAAADSRIDGDALSNLESQGVRSNLPNHAGRIAACNFRHRHFDARHASPEEDIDVIDRRRFHFDQDVAVGNLGIGHVLVLKNFGPTVLVKNDCFHESP